jgi:hypothetical protein
MINHDVLCNIETDYKNYIEHIYYCKKGMKHSYYGVYGTWTWRFITVFRRERHWSLSWARCIQSTTSHPISLRSILILSCHLHLPLPNGLIPSGFPIKIFLCMFHVSHTCYMPRLSHANLFDHTNNVWWNVQFMTLIMLRLHPPTTSSLLRISSV